MEYIAELVDAWFNPFTPNVFSHPYQLDESIFNFRVVGRYLFSFNQIFRLLLANSGDPDQTLRFAVSNLVLHCLQVSNKDHTRLIWVNIDMIKG